MHDVTTTTMSTPVEPRQSNILTTVALEHEDDEMNVWGEVGSIDQHECLQGVVRVASISDNVTERRLKVFGRVRQRPTAGTSL